ncbi:MAG: Trp biosynthesis-associated membrane protein [Kibdelosporangium sp.]
MTERMSWRVLLAALALGGAAVLWWSYQASWGLGAYDELSMRPVLGSEVMPILLVLTVLAAAAATMVFEPWAPVRGFGGIVLVLTGVAALWLGWTGTPVHGNTDIDELTSCSGSNDLCEIGAPGQYLAIAAGVLLGCIGLVATVRARRD